MAYAVKRPKTREFFGWALVEVATWGTVLLLASIGTVSWSVAIGSAVLISIASWFGFKLWFRSSGGEKRPT